MPVRVGFHLERFWGQGGGPGGQEGHGLQLILSYLGNGILLVELNGFTGRSKVLDPIRETDHSDKSPSHNMHRHKPGQNLQSHHLHQGVSVTESTVSQLRNQNHPKIH